MIWVHDYHLIPLAAELRAMGCKQRIGFFCTSLMPPPLIMAAIPQHEWLMRSLFAYDLVGLQSEADVAYFTRYVRNEGGAEAVDEKSACAFGATVVVVVPIGIDVDEFTRLTPPDALETYENMRDEYSRRRLLLGIDRLDYPRASRTACGPSASCWTATLKPGQRDDDHDRLPSRDDVHAYATCARSWRACAARSMATMASWTDARALYPPHGGANVCRACPRRRRGATPPLRDGMNLVAKGIRGGAGPGQPRRAGAVTLCRCGRAIERSAAGQPLRPQGMADSIQHALQMPLAERQARHQKLMARIQEHDVHWWQGIHGCAAGRCGLKPPTLVTDEGAQASLQPASHPLGNQADHKAEQHGAGQRNEPVAPKQLELEIARQAAPTPGAAAAATGR